MAEVEIDCTFFCHQSIFLFSRYCQSILELGRATICLNFSTDLTKHLEFYPQIEKLEPNVGEVN